MRFIQIAVATDPENGEVLYALSDNGDIYERATAYYSPGGKYQEKSITKGRTYTSPFWRKVELPFDEPALDDAQLRRLEFERIIPDAEGSIDGEGQ